MALYYAASLGKIIDVKDIIESGTCNIDEENIDGNTPLYIAAAWGHEDHLEVIKLLIAHNADLNKPNKNGQTPLYVAASWGHVVVVKYLIEQGSKLDMQMKDGRTALHVAAVSKPHLHPLSSDDPYCMYTARSKVEMCKIARAYMEEVMKSGQHAELLTNIESDYKTLINYTDVRISDSLLEMIVFYNHFATVVELVNAGATLDIRDNKKETVLAKANYSEHTPMIKFLTQKGATE